MRLIAEIVVYLPACTLSERLVCSMRSAYQRARRIHVAYAYASHTRRIRVAYQRAFRIQAQQCVERDVYIFTIRHRCC